MASDTAGDQMRLTIQKATEMAIESAKTSNERHQVGAVIFDRSNYCVSVNRTFSVKVQNRDTPYSEHAEANVITHALHSGINLERSILVVVRVNRCGNLRLAKPCKSCQKLINQFNIKRVYYSNDPLHREHTPENFKSLE